MGCQRVRRDKAGEQDILHPFAEFVLRRKCREERRPGPRNVLAAGQKILFQELVQPLVRICIMRDDVPWLPERNMAPADPEFATHDVSDGPGRRIRHLALAVGVVDAGYCPGLLNPVGGNPDDRDAGLRGAIDHVGGSAGKIGRASVPHRYQQVDLAQQEVA